MKIKKMINENLIEKVIVEDSETVETDNVSDASIEDVKDASVDEIADAVQASGVLATDGEGTYSDKGAENIAKEIKTAAKGLDRTAWAPLDVRSVLTDTLDMCLASALKNKKSGLKDGSDLLVNGLPGSGKTGIVKYWAEARGLNLVELDSNDDELGAMIKGFPVDTIQKDADGNEYHATAKSFSSSLDDLDKPNSVLFLDEFNRAPQSLRANLLKLINAHEIPGRGKNGRRRFDNMLFTIACINPKVDSDFGVVPLNDAEKSRFAVKRRWDSKVPDALRYLNFYLQDTIEKLDKTDEDYAFLYANYVRIHNIATALLTDHRFEFDTRDDLEALDDDEYSMLNQRSLTDGLMLAGGQGKKEFLRWVDEDSGFLDKNITTIHEILDPWQEPDVTVPGASGVNTSANKAVNATAASQNNSTSSVSSSDDDFESKFGNGGIETDTDLFGTTSSGAAKGAAVSAAEAKNRIQNFDFSL